MSATVIDLIPNRQAAKELDVSLMSLWRYDHDDDLIAAGWPLPVFIRRKKYRDRAQFERFKATMMRRAIGARGG
jgi:hypothetical protein